MEETVLVIVESPTKARTIKRFLPKNFRVEASVGHVRDLPQSASEIPARVKKEPWARLGINVEDDFAPLYVTPKGKSKVIRQLRDQLKDADALYLATDEDREGESISWHLIQTLKPKVPVKRMVFHEITRKAIEEAVEHPRDINQNLVQAQETRRILDRLVGYSVSPLIWKKIAYGLSAGRVQSAGLRMTVERERERMRFRRAVYFDLKADLAADSQPFTARLIEREGRRLANGKDFDPETGHLFADTDALILTEADAGKLATTLRDQQFRVESITERQSTSRPAPPFITSTLQQEANRKLGMGSRDTMRTAQRLYENGLITYMRTDSPTLSGEAIGASRRAVESSFGKDLLSPKPRQYSARSANAQEAHEAIRPAGGTFRHPKDAGLSGRELRLYEMIWKRTLATQMKDATKSSRSVRINAGDCVFLATGTTIVDPGFLKLYVESRDDKSNGEEETILPDMSEGVELELRQLLADKHETRPPARYTEASLVQRLEKEGIGRPSTYASIISTLFERGYVRKQGSAMVPTYTGFGVTQFLERHFNDLVDYRFTREMEQHLDEIASGDLGRSEYLRSFYLSGSGLKKQIEERESGIDPEECRVIDIPALDGSRQLRIGRYGAYVVAESEGEKIHVTVPEDVAPGDLDPAQIEDLIEVQKRGPEPLGVHPESGEKIYVLSGRYGPYVQLGEATEENPKPKRASVPREMNPRELTIADATRLLSVPRTLGQHPESGKDVVAGLGRFGPFVVHDGDFRSIPASESAYDIGLERALELLAQEKKGRRRGPKLIRALGTVPGAKQKVGLYDGQYGPYLKVGSNNHRIPEEWQKPDALEKLDLKQALQIVGAK